ncbi:hypothetical protein [Anabaena subtropica]|uniref:Uncharacterized protein n=1 Tax=Anabaena subtropica FACHB-260 TaxID=2692884 RepID=A0ABR8CKW0_9NOST|nr:hypothetical protein [Anabaena subtropica]MBD2342944.1 hypothetical protein [Anabaena subtropica FACHB-260]
MSYTNWEKEGDRHAFLKSCYAWRFNFLFLIGISAAVTQYFLLLKQRNTNYFQEKGVSVENTYTPKFLTQTLVVIANATALKNAKSKKQKFLKLLILHI